MICKCCNQDKRPYHFFNHRNRYDETFFTRPIIEIDGLCFDCAAPYRCLKCGQVKGAGEFRLQGRVCMACKSPKPTSFLRHKGSFYEQISPEYTDPLENA